VQKYAYVQCAHIGRIGCVAVVAGTRPGAPAQLPRDTPGYVGRLAQRDALRAGLSALLPAEADGSPTVYVITGMGGIGKTALAVLVAHQVSSAYPDGQLYADLKGASPRPVDPHATLGHVLRELGVAKTAVPAETDERVALFRSTLALRRVLLLLDDARDAAQVRPLIPGAAGCAVLVTSRKLLAGLDGARRVELGTLDTAESRTMFERILGPGRGTADLAATEEILASCAGLPLAIRIAAARLSARPAWTPRTLADRLTATRRLDELAIDDRAVRTCFDASYAALADGGSAAEAAMARAFALLGLWEGPDVDPRAAGASGHRALAILRETGDRAGEAIALNRISTVHHVQGRVEEALDYQRHALAIYTELGDLTGVAASHNNIGMYHASRGGYTEALAHLDQARAIVREIRAPGTEAGVLGSIGEVCHRLGRTEQAENAFRQALVICVANGDRRHEAMCHQWLGRLAQAADRRDEARGHWSRALAILEESGDSTADELRRLLGA
jgi:tetratricopeptide (TPR) repeat protein